MSKSSIVDKNGLGEYEILNFRHFRQSGDLLDTIGPSKSLCYVLKHKLYLKLLRFCAPLIPPKIAKKCQLYMIYRPSCTEVPISQVPSRTKSFISQVLSTIKNHMNLVPFCFFTDWTIENLCNFAKTSYMFHTVAIR